MTLPTFEKTWQYDLNKTATNGPGILLQIKNSLKGFAQNPWTVVGSSNGTVFGMDGVDRWVTEADVINSPTIASWIVLKQTGILGNFQLMISNRGQSLGMTASVSSNAGFTGGSASANPTATDQVILRDGANGASGYFGISNSSTVYKINVWLSADGQCTRVAMYANSSTVLNCWMTAHWLFERVKNPTNGWATPYVAGIIGVSIPSGIFDTASTTSLYSHQTYSNRITSNHGSITMPFYLGFEGCFYPGNGTNNYPLSSIFLSENKIDGLPPMYPIGLTSIALGVRGRHGQFYDMYWCTVTYAEGSTVTNEFGRTFCRIGRFLMPWPSAATVLVKG